LNQAIANTVRDQNTIEQALFLPDGRRIVAIQPAEAHLIWRSMAKGGLYGKAAQQLQEGDTILDIGGHVGLASMYFASAAPKLQIISAEAAPRTYACLKANLALHLPDATALNVAVSNTRGARLFTFYENSPGNSSLYANRHQDDATTRQFLLNAGVDEPAIEELVEDLHRPTVLTVQTVTVSDLIEAHGVTSIGLLKIDVERAELDVALGLEERHWPLIRHVVAEVHTENGRLEALIALLEAKGFVVSVSQDPSLRGTELVDLDAVRRS
jgi:FkbM family methyltransferase